MIQTVWDKIKQGDFLRVISFVFISNCYKSARYLTVFTILCAFFSVCFTKSNNRILQFGK